MNRTKFQIGLIVGLFSIIQAEGPIIPHSQVVKGGSREIAADSLHNGDSASHPDSLEAARSLRQDSTIVVRHRFNHRVQVIAGSVIMSCLAFVLVTMNNYNPR